MDRYAITYEYEGKVQTRVFEKKEHVTHFLKVMVGEPSFLLISSEVRRNERPRFVAKAN